MTKLTRAAIAAGAFLALGAFPTVPPAMLAAQEPAAPSDTTQSEGSSPAAPDSSGTPAPLSIARILPGSASPGDTVLLMLSTNLGDTTNILVTFGEVPARIVEPTFTQIRVEVPLPPGPAPTTATDVCVTLYEYNNPVPQYCNFRIFPRSAPAQAASRIPSEWIVAGVAALAVLGVLVILVLRDMRRSRLLRQELAEARYTMQTIRSRGTGASSTLGSSSSAGDDSTAPVQPPAPDQGGTVPDPPQELVRACVAQECILFAGGGIGAQAGLPTWIEGLTRISARLSEEQDGGYDHVHSPGLLAELIASRVPREQLLGLVKETFQRPVAELPEVFPIMAQIPFAGVVTPNWDHLLERVFESRKPRVVSPRNSQEFAELFRERQFTIMKLYGDPAAPIGFFFTPDEYRRATVDDPAFSKLLSSLFLTGTFFFAGTSLAGMADFLSALHVGDAGHGRTHFALVPWVEDIEIHRELFQRKYGVQLLDYRPTPGFPEVAEFFRKLRDAVRAPARGVAAEPQHALLNEVRLQNIGPFPELSLELRPGWNVLLGNNGSGKSTVLRAIALGLCGDEVREKAARAAAGLLRADTTSGFIELVVGATVYRTDLVRDGDQVRVRSRQLTPVQAGQWVVLGFPPLRGVSTRDPAGVRPDGVTHPVVEDVLPLLRGSTDSRMDNLKQWIVNLQVRAEGGKGIPPAEAKRNRELSESFFRLMDQITPGDRLRFDHLDKKSWRVMVRTQGGVVPLDLISQGMSSMMAWVGVLLARMYEIYGGRDKPEEQSALVLVDEIDAHMHPEWQRTIVQFVRDRFPNVQVIATTHSPLVVGNLSGDEVMHVHRDRNGELEILRLGTAFRGMRADQILTSSAFALETTLDTDTQGMLKRYADRLGSSTGDGDEELEDLARQVGARIPRHPETEEGRQALELMEQWMMERLAGQSEDQRRKVLAEAEKYLAEIMTPGGGQ